MVTLYGIKNCDTVRKARKWLESHGVDYTFHDFRADGLDKTALKKWAGECGWENLLNRRGTTWRKLPETERENLSTDKAIALMLANPAVIKRPVLDVGKSRHVGFSPAEYAAIFST